MICRPPMSTHPHTPFPSATPFRSYPRTDVRCDGAYLIFYMCINLGAALGSLLCGYLGKVYGWKYGFGAAGFGMLAGLIVFVIGKPLLKGKGESSNQIGRAHV